MVPSAPMAGELLTRSTPVQILTLSALSGPGLGLCPVWLRSWPSIGQAVSARHDGEPGLHAAVAGSFTASRAMAAVRTTAITQDRLGVARLDCGIWDLHHGGWT